MGELKNVLRLTLKEKRDVTLAVVFGFIAGSAAVALLASSGFLISEAALTGQMATLVIMAACLKLFGITAAISRYAERLFSHRATFTMLSNLRVEFFRKLAPLAPGIFNKHRSGDLLARIVGDVESLQNFLLRVFYPPVVLILVFVSTILFTAYYSVYIALALFLGLLLTVFIIPAIFAVRRRKQDWRIRAARGELSTETTEFLYGFRDLKIYQQLGNRKEELKKVSNLYAEERRKEGKEASFSQTVNGMAALLISWLVLGIGAYTVAAGQLDGLFLAMLVMISLAVFENVGPMAAFPSHYEESRKAAERLDEVVAEEERDNLLEGIQDGPFGISVEDVSYSYEKDGRNAIEKAVMNFSPGTKTAIVGPSGSGKSTLMQLLLGTAAPDAGTIHFGGVPNSRIDPEELWDRSNIVLQENHFFYGTIRSNLLIAKEEAEDAELEDALRKVQLDSFELSMKVEEKGGNLSGGEKQRLAIARAILKGQPLWLLDEPVSSVDSVTSRIIYDALFDERPNDTFIIISHDLAGLEQMDQIIVMENGQVAETGSYEELMDAKGYFFGLKEIETSIFAP